MIPPPMPEDLLIDIAAEYQLADRDSMRRALIRRLYAAENKTGDWVISDKVLTYFGYEKAFWSDGTYTEFPGLRATWEQPQGMHDNYYRWIVSIGSSPAFVILPGERKALVEALCK